MCSIPDPCNQDRLTFKLPTTMTSCNNGGTLADPVTLNWIRARWDLSSATVHCKHTTETWYLPGAASTPCHFPRAETESSSPLEGSYVGLRAKWF